MEQRAGRGSPHPSRLTPHALTPYASRLTPLALPLALFFALVLFQLIPLPPSLLRIFSPQTYELYTQVLPGWPLRVPYADLGQMSEVRDQSASPLTPDPSRASQRSEVRRQRSTIRSRKPTIPKSAIPISKLPGGSLLHAPCCRRPGSPSPSSPPSLGRIF